MKKILVLLSFIAIIAFSAEACKHKEKQQKVNDDKKVVEQNDQNVDKTNNQVQDADANSNSEGFVIQMTSKQFKDKIFDFDNNQQWNYKGNLPCIVDFYADWCRPCKMVAPIMAELSIEYKGKINFYKINVDNEQAVASSFGIQSIPTVLFIPKSGQPQMSVGAMQKEGYVNAIKQVLKVQ